MPRRLPDRPSLEFLRKEAKDLLQDLLRERPSAQLADAQHALAREYGFASWPKLKAHVDDSTSEAAGGGGAAHLHGDEPSPEPLFPRFTPRARQALFFARYEAAQCGRRSIEPVDVLLGIIRVSSGQLRRLFDAAGITLEDARAALGRVAAGAEALPSSVQIPFRPDASGTFRTAGEESDHLGQRDIGLAHLTLAVWRRDPDAASFLGRGRISVEAVRGVTATMAADDVI